MRIELFLDEGEEYPQLFSVWKVDQETGRADMTTRRNYVDDRKGWEQWRDTDEKNIMLKVENAKLRELARLLLWGVDNDMPRYEELAWTQKVNALVRELGVEVE